MPEPTSQADTELAAAPKQRRRGRPKAGRRTAFRPAIDEQMLGEALVHLIKGNPNAKQLASDIAEERHQAQQSFVSEREKQQGETHHWITFHKMGDQDQVTHVFIGAAGVAYNIRKGERVPLPQSAINALELAVREGLDHGHPIIYNGRKYLRKIKERDYSYTIDGTCSPEEAAEWRSADKRAAAQNSDLVQVGGPPESDMVEIGAA